MSLTSLRYGQPTVPLARKVIVRGLANEPGLELFPPQIKVHLLSTQPITQDQDALTLTISIKVTLHDLYAQILQVIPNDSPNPPQRRIWKLTEGSHYHQRYFPITRLKENGASPLEDNPIKIVEDAMIEHGDTFVVEEQDLEGHWLIDGMPKSATVSGTTTPLIVEQPPKLFGSSNWADNYLSTKSDEPSSSFRSPTTIKISPSVKAKAPSVIPGTLGLGNM